MERKELLEEQLLRENIRKAIRIVKNKRLNEEKHVRAIVKSLLREAERALYDYTSLNRLDTLFRDVIGGAREASNTKFKEEYMSLTSDPSERGAFIEHVLNMAAADFNQLRANGVVRTIGPDFTERGYEIEEPPEIEEPEEPLTVSIEDLAAQGGDMLPKEEEEEIELEEDDVIGEDPQEESESDSTFMAARSAYATIAPALEKFWIASPTNNPVEPSPDLPSSIKTEGDLFQHLFNVNIRLWAQKLETEINTRK
jgi:hypothetical protein